MKYCSTCGHPLILKEHEHEGRIPYCEQCQEYRFPVFSTAVSMLLLNPEKDKILLIKQYGRDHNVLVAGYVNQKESLEETLIRELEEEIGLKVKAYRYNRSEYFPNTNTLMCNFTVVADDECLDHVSDWEVDEAKWYSFEEAKHEVKPCSLAQRFLFDFFKKWQDANNRYDFSWMEVKDTKKESL